MRHLAVFIQYKHWGWARKLLHVFLCNPHDFFCEYKKLSVSQSSLFTNSTIWSSCLIAHRCKEPSCLMTWLRSLSLTFVNEKTSILLAIVMLYQGSASTSQHDATGVTGLQRHICFLNHKTGQGGWLDETTYVVFKPGLHRPKLPEGLCEKNNYSCQS